eukprot:3213387-Pyramimonas_sp.AAC.1
MLQLCNHWKHWIRCIWASAPLRDLPPATRHFRTWTLGLYAAPPTPWGAPGRSLGGLLAALLKPFGGLWWASWSLLGASWGPLGASWRLLGAEGSQFPFGPPPGA